MREITKPKKRTVQAIKTVLVKPAHYKEVPTGDIQIIKIRDENGVERTEERPIINRVFVDAVREEVEIEKAIFAVETGAGDSMEVHEFATKKDADRYYLGAR